MHRVVESRGPEDPPDRGPRTWLLPVGAVAIYALAAGLAFGALAKGAIGLSPWGVLSPALLMLPVVAIVALRRDVGQWVPPALVVGTVAAYVGLWPSFSLGGNWAVASWFFGAPINVVVVLLLYGLASRRLRAMRDGEPPDQSASSSDRNNGSD
jgi:hypothetical protein